MNIRSFDEAYVISDLHIGGAPNFQMFASSQRFAEFVAYLEKRLTDLRRQQKARGNGDAEILLVINGDFVDLLAEQEKDYFLLRQGETLLHRILEDSDRFPLITQSLQKFVARSGAHLVVVLGNHDLELALPDCREALVQIITAGNPVRRARVELCFEGWGYRFQVAGRRALCLHGNETDIFNFTRYDELDRIQREVALHGESVFGESWKPSAGTQFVVDAVNPLKRPHPFVDLMHPLIPLVPAVLGLFNPGNVRFADEVAALTTTALANEAIRPASQRRMLSVEAPLAIQQINPAQGHSAAEITAEVERAMTQGRIDELIHGGLNRHQQTLGMFSWIETVRDAAADFRNRTVDLARTTVRRLTEAKQAAHREMVRRVLSSIVEEHLDSPMELSHTDTAIEKTIGGQYDVIFVGHTHHRRLARRAGGMGIHVNTGTWADRMTLLQHDVGNGHRFAEIYRALISDDRQDLLDPQLNLVRRECPVGVLGTLPRQRSVTASLGTVPEGSTGGFDVEIAEPLN